MPTASLAKSLLDLPRELRDDIWKLALLTPDMTVVDIGSAPQLAIQPALCRVDRQLRRETLSMFYQRNTFRIGVTNTAHKTAELWLAAIGKDNIQNLRYLTFRSLRVVESCLQHACNRADMDVSLNERHRRPSSCYLCDSGGECSMVKIDGIFDLRVAKLEVSLCRCKCRSAWEPAVPPTAEVLRGTQAIIDRNIQKSDISRRSAFGLVQLMDKFDRCCRHEDMKLVLQNL